MDSDLLLLIAEGSRETNQYLEILIEKIEKLTTITDEINTSLKINNNDCIEWPELEPNELNTENTNNLLDREAEDLKDILKEMIPLFKDLLKKYKEDKK